METSKIDNEKVNTTAHSFKNSVTEEYTIKTNQDIDKILSGFLGC